VDKKGSVRRGTASGDRPFRGALAARREWAATKLAKATACVSRTDICGPHRLPVYCSGRRIACPRLRSLRKRRREAAHHLAGPRPEDRNGACGDQRKRAGGVRAARKHQCVPRCDAPSCQGPQDGRVCSAVPSINWVCPEWTVLGILPGPCRVGDQCCTRLPLAGTVEAGFGLRGNGLRGEGQADEGGPETNQSQDRTTHLKPPRCGRLQNFTLQCESGLRRRFAARCSNTVRARGASEIHRLQQVRFVRCSPK
jgi:hypothetical protein